MNVAFIVISNDLPWSIGTQILSSCLKKRGIDVNTLFVSHIKESILTEIKKFVESSDLIGLPVLTNHFETASIITSYLREHMAAPIIWGGIHPTLRPEECIAIADIICIGEGEESVLSGSGRLTRMAS